jgi:hypothetical protein
LTVHRHRGHLGRTRIPLRGKEGLEPDGSLSQINKLRISLRIRTPDIPSNTRIWHSIWHWTNSVACELLGRHHIANRCHFYRNSSVNEPQETLQWPQRMSLAGVRNRKCAGTVVLRKHAGAGPAPVPEAGPALRQVGQCTYEAYTERVVVPVLPVPNCGDAPSQNASGAAYQEVLPSP